MEILNINDTCIINCYKFTLINAIESSASLMINNLSNHMNYIFDISDKLLIVDINISLTVSEGQVFISSINDSQLLSIAC